MEARTAAHNEQEQHELNVGLQYVEMRKKLSWTGLLVKSLVLAGFPVC